MSIRDEPVIRTATLPDGRNVQVRVVVPDEPYIAREELDTVALELTTGDATLGIVETTLSAEDGEEARRLAERVRQGLEAGSIEPTAEGIEHIALTPPA